MLESIKNDPQRNFFCVDDEEVAKNAIFGQQQLDNYQRFELLVLPCHSTHTDTGQIEGTKGQISEECVANLEQQKQYMGTANVLIYTNQVRFMPDRFGDTSLKRYSAIVNQQFDGYKPAWYQTTIQQNQLQDETDFFQFGQEDL